LIRRINEWGLKRICKYPGDGINWTMRALLARLRRFSEKKAKSSPEAKIVFIEVKFETESTMARGSKTKYTSKQKRKASKIERGYKQRGVSTKEAERRAWATVNKSDKGGRKKGGGGRGKKRSKSSSRKGGIKGGRR
jgi:hypothetical protein